MLQFTFYVFAVSPRGTASDFRFTNFHFFNYSLSNVKHFKFQKEMGIINLRKEKNTDFSLNDTFDSLTYKGFLNFFAKNTSFAMGNFLSS